MPPTTKQYSVVLRGQAHVVVDAENQGQAIQLALASDLTNVHWSIKTVSGMSERTAEDPSPEAPLVSNDE